MKRKLLAIIAAMFITSTASAQFEEGKIYVGGSLTGLDLNYSGSEDLKIGLDAKLGYFIADDVMLYGQVGLQHAKSYNDIMLGVGGRYYIVQNGLYLGANGKYVHHKGGYNDFMPGVEVGYAFFINRTITIEPAIYYDQSLKDHSDFSTIGLKVGIGLNLFND